MVAADGALTRLSVDDPSLDTIYTRFFEQQAAGAQGDARCGVRARPGRDSARSMLKELADHFDSVRMTAARLADGARPPRCRSTARSSSCAATTAEDPFLLLKLFNPGGQTLSVVSILGFVIPVMAIGLGFDAINGEHNRRTLSRILAQPIYRDALLAGKFLAGLTILAVNLTCLWLLVVGLGVLSARRAAERRRVHALVRFPDRSPWPMPGSGSPWRCCSRCCSARRRPRRCCRSASGCS